jgi:hypothetical protein
MTRVTRRRSAATTPEEPDEDESPEETPTRGSRRGSGRTNTASKRSRDEDDEPRAGKRRPSRDKDSDEDEKAPVSSGWGAYEDLPSSGGGDFPERFDITEEPVLVKLLDDEPYGVYRQHWIERKGKKSWTCLEKRCPMCDDLGDKPSPHALFNVIDLSDPDEPVLKYLDAGSTVANIFKKYAGETKTQPLNRDDLYWEVSKTVPRGKGKTVFTIHPVKARDLQEDWDMEPLTEDEIAEFEENAFTKDSIYRNTRAQLDEVVEELT